MEESGENWPCDSDLEAAGDGDVNKDLIFEEREFVCDGDDSFSDSEEGQTHKKGELTERLLALSATIPGSNKIDDTSILEKASNYVKQLQERVRELEQEVDESKICSSKGKKSKGSSSNCEEVKYCDEYYYGTNDNILPEVKARVLQKDVLIIIHCEKEKGVMLKILTQLDNLHLSVVNSSVLRFGKSTLDITIVAQMSDEYNIAVDELVRTLRAAISTQ